VPVSKELVRLEHSAVKLTLTVPKEDVGSQYDDLVAEYLKSAQIKGFRKGKVPRNVLEQKFGADLKNEALNKIIGKAVSGVFEEEGFAREDKPLPYSEPRLDEEGGAPGFDLTRDLVFSVIYDVLPAVTVGPWKGLEVEIPAAEVDDEVMRGELDKIRERNAIILDREDTAAAVKDNVVTVNYCELDADNNPLPGTERADFVFTLGSLYNIYEFDDEIAGMKTGETKDITRSFAGDYKYSDLAGRTVSVRVTLTALKEKKLPELDDDLAQDVDERYKTLEDLKNSVRERLQKNLDKRVRDLAISQLLEKVLETTPIDLPESMIRLEQNARMRNLARRFNIDTGELEANLEKSGQDPKSLRESWRGDAEKALKSRLIVENLLEEQNFEVTDEDMEKEYAFIAEESGSSIEETKNYYRQENAADYLAEEIKERRLFDLFIAENKIKRGTKKSYLDIMGTNV
jgi:trigger factor